MEMGIFLSGEILDPFSLFDHNSAKNTFDQIGCLTDGEQGNDANAGKTGQTPGKRHAENPYKAAVKQEGHHGLTAGAEGEVSGVGIGIEGQCNGIQQDQHSCQLLNRFRGVVDPGEGNCCCSHQKAKGTAADSGSGKQLPVVILNFLSAASGAQHLAHDDAHGTAHGQKYHTADIV